MKGGITMDEREHPLQEEQMSEAKPTLPENEAQACENPSSPAPEGDAPTAKKAFDPAAELYDWLEVVVIAVAVVLLLFTFVGRVATVDGGSMLPTLTHGERLLVQELGYKPAQGDIVICQSVTYGMETPLVKRIIALEGQTITVDFKNWKVFVDGVELEEDYINYQPTAYMNGWDYGDSYTVPEGCVFVMGDNRNNSQDSRRIAVGPIDERLILGRAVLGISAKDGIRIFS